MEVLAQFSFIFFLGIWLLINIQIKICNICKAINMVAGPCWSHNKWLILLLLFIMMMLLRSTWQKVFYFWSLSGGSSGNYTQLPWENSLVPWWLHFPIIVSLSQTLRAFLSGLNSYHLWEPRRNLFSNSKEEQLGKWVGAIDEAQVLFGEE